MRQKIMAKQLGVSESWVSAWVAGRSRIPAYHAVMIADMAKDAGWKQTGANKILDMPGEDLKRLIQALPENKEE